MLLSLGPHFIGNIRGVHAHLVFFQSNAVEIKPQLHIRDIPQQGRQVPDHLRLILIVRKPDLFPQFDGLPVVQAMDMFAEIFGRGSRGILKPQRGTLQNDLMYGIWTGGCV